MNCNEIFSRTLYIKILSTRHWIDLVRSLWHHSLVCIPALLPPRMCSMLTAHPGSGRPHRKGSEPRSGSQTVSKSGGILLSRGWSTAAGSVPAVLRVGHAPAGSSGKCGSKCVVLPVEVVTVIHNLKHRAEARPRAGLGGAQAGC